MRWAGVLMATCALLACDSSVSGGGGEVSVGGHSFGGQEAGGHSLGGQGGQGSAPACVTAADCPAPAEPCRLAACIDEGCGVVDTPTGMPCPGGVCVSGVCGCEAAADCPPPGVCEVVDCSAAHTCDSHSAVVGTPCVGGVCAENNDCVECVEHQDCPAPANVCETAWCSGNQCVVYPTNAWTPCPTGYCDGMGSCLSCLNDVHCPSDGCNSGVCVGGACSSLSYPDGTSCGNLDSCNTGVCSGGVCTQVPRPDGTSCGPNPDPCHFAECVAGGCTMVPRPDGAVCGAGLFCDSNGQCGPCAMPCAPGECEVVTCPQGACVHGDAPSSTPCSNGGVCTGTGECVECNSPLHCPGPDYFDSVGQTCEYWTCDNHVCAVHDKTNGTYCNGADQGACLFGGCTGCNSSLACAGGFVCCGAPSYQCRPMGQPCP